MSALLSIGILYFTGLEKAISQVVQELDSDALVFGSPMGLEGSKEWLLERKHQTTN